MKKSMRKRILSLALAAVIVTCFIPVFALEGALMEGNNFTMEPGTYTADPLGLNGTGAANAWRITDNGGKDGSAGYEIKAFMKDADTFRDDFSLRFSKISVPTAAQVNTQVIEFDVKPMLSNLDAAIWVKPAGTNNVPLMFGFTKTGKIAGCWGRAPANDADALYINGNPEFIYGVVHPVPEELRGVKYFEEVPLGTGSVDFPAYLKALEEIGYRGFLTIEREVGDNPEADIKTAADFLAGIIKGGN